MMPLGGRELLTVAALPLPEFGGKGQLGVLPGGVGLFQSVVATGANALDAADIKGAAGH